MKRIMRVYHMKLKYGVSPTISIDLAPGIYLLPAQAAIGKSYMCSMFHDLASIDRVCSHVFPDKFHAEEVLDNSKRDVVMLDRYDMCTEDFTSYMSRFAEHGILLVDCKSNSFPLPYRFCRMRMYENELVIR